MPLPPKLQEYQQSVLGLRNSPYLNWPSHIHLETMAQCNAACIFCPSPVLQRQGERMPDALVAKILNELTDIPPSVPFQISPFKVNEPFLDPRLFDILAEINRKLPHTGITLTTNSTPLTAKKLDQLSRIRNLGYLWISMNDHRKSEYEQTMGLPYARTIERLELIHGKSARGELPFRVILSRVGNGTAADVAFEKWVKEHYPRFDSFVFQRGNWVGQVDGAQAEIPDVACARWFELSITATGIVAHCCMDGQAAWPIGDANSQHVLDIYNAPAYRALRESAMTRIGHKPCDQCCFL